MLQFMNANKRRAKHLAIASLLGTIPLAIATSVSADSVSDFYKGKTISAIIGFGPGGGYDTYMRTLTNHMGKHIPGNPKMVPRNMPGAGGMIAANYIYNSAPKDGTLIGIFASSTLFSKALGEKRANFQIRGFTWIGNLDQTVGTCAVWHKSGYKSFDDIRKRGAIFGGTGPSGVGATFPRGMNAMLGTKIKIITGYPGSSSVVLAMKREEIHGGCTFALSSLMSARYKDWKSGRIKVVIQTGIEKSPLLKGVPHIYDFAKSEEDRQVMNLIYGPHVLGRPISAPPGVPDDRAKALQAAFQATVKDPAFLAEAKKRRLAINPWGPKEINDIIDKFTSYPPSTYKKVASVLNFGAIQKVKLKTLVGTIATVKKRRISVKDGAGKMVNLKVHPRRTKLKIAGKKAKISALKANMSCTFKYVGAGDVARQVSCK